VGTLHAYQSVRFEALVSTGFTPVGAGSHIAVNDAIAMLMLPIFVMMGTYMGLRPMLTVMPLITIFCTVQMAWYLAGHNADAGRGHTPDLSMIAALQLMSVAELCTPIAPLVLVCQNSRRLGASFGAGESIFAVLQMVLVLLSGLMRKLGGFPGAMLFLTCGAAFAGIVGIKLIPRLRDLPNACNGSVQQLCSQCRCRSREQVSHLSICDHEALTETETTL